MNARIRFNVSNECDEISVNILYLKIKMPHRLKQMLTKLIHTQLESKEKKMYAESKVARRNLPISTEHKCFTCNKVFVPAGRNCPQSNFIT